MTGERLGRRGFLGAVGAFGGMAVGGGAATRRVAGQTASSSGLTVGVTDPQLLRSVSPFDFSSLGSPLEALFDRGTVVGSDGTVHPWAFSDWAVVDEDGPRVAVRLRDGLTWHDGDPVTAEDVAFSFDYLSARTNVAVAPRANRLSAVDDATADDDGVVTLALSSPVGSWPTSVLRVPIVPEHVWEGIDDPRNAAEEIDPERRLLGSGPFRVAAERDGSLALERREEPHPALAALDGLPDRPHITELVYRTLDGGGAATVDAVADGPYDTVESGQVTWSEEVGSAVEADDRVRLESATSPILDMAQYNTRRVPLDDVAFRRFLSTSFDRAAYLEAGGAGVTKGDLVMSTAFPDYRSHTADEATRYELPREDGDPDVEALFASLTEQSGSTHDYEFDDGLLVDGVPFDEAHTDNDGGGGQGPLQFAVLTDERELLPDVARRWAGTLREIGVPAEVTTTGSFGDLLDPVFRNQRFDVLVSGIISLGPGGTWLDLFFGEGGIEESGEAISYNPTGYTGAQPAIDATATMDDGEHRAAVREAVGVIYQDAPAVVFGYRVLPTPTSTAWSGFRPTHRGTTNRLSWATARSESMSAATRTATRTPTATTEPSTPTPATEDDTPVPGYAGGDRVLDSLGSAALPLGLGAVTAVGATLYAAARMSGGSGGGTGFGGGDGGGASGARRDGSAGPGDGDATGAHDDDGSGAGATPTGGTTGSGTAGGDAASAAGAATAAAGSVASGAATPAGGGLPPALSAHDRGDADAAFAEAAGLLAAVPVGREGGARWYDAALEGAPGERVRVLAVDDAAPDGVREATVAAARQWASLTHDNVLDVREWGEEPRPWLAIETTDGGTLADADGLPLPDRVGIVCDACDAVRHAGLYNTAHGCLAPGRVHLAPGDDRPAARVSAWGMGDLLDGGAVTPYDAPEQVTGGDVGRHTDVYRAGAVAYRTICGRPPVDPDADDLGGAVAAGDVTPPGEVDAALAPFDDAMARALHPDPESRYRSTHHLRLDLTGALD